MTAVKSPQQILKKHWNYSHFRPLQEEIISSVLDKNDTIALLPTGGGKSICFQVPALINNGICIVISPLIALIKDQVKNLKNKGIKATEIPSGSSQDEIITLFDNIKFGKYKFLYISPERLQSRFIQEKIKELNVSMIAVDEAHCISEWGHDFRPAYRNISVLREIHPSANIIAVTATATKKVIKDIETSLALENISFFKKSFFRENLTYQIIKTEDKLYKLIQIFTKIKEPAIIYVSSRKRTKEIRDFLIKNNFSASMYNGGMSPSEKQENFNLWLNEKSQIMVATNAFGMGIDKANVRVVIHFDLPNSIENYVQESGRAGRDEKKAHAVLLTNENDISVYKKTQGNSIPTINDIKTIYVKIHQHFQIAKGEVITEVLNFNFLEFCSKYNFPTRKVFTTLQMLSNFGVIDFQTNSQKKSTIKFLVSSTAILQYTNSSRKKIIQGILRTYAGIFENNIELDEFYIAKKLGITSFTLIDELEKLTQENIIEYHKNSKDASITLFEPREDNRTINRYQKQITQFLNSKKERTSNIIQFIKNDSVCRNIQILTYFGEQNGKKCTQCDVCKNNNTISKNITTDILKTIQKHKKISSQKISEILPYPEKEILVTLQLLISEEKILLENNMYYTD